MTARIKSETAQWRTVGEQPSGVEPCRSNRQRQYGLACTSENLVDRGAVEMLLHRAVAFRAHDNHCGLDLFRRVQDAIARGTQFNPDMDGFVRYEFVGDRILCL